jgi:hypothetical protein
MSEFERSATSEEEQAAYVEDALREVAKNEPGGLEGLKTRLQDYKDTLGMYARDYEHDEQAVPDAVAESAILAEVKAARGTEPEQLRSAESVMADLAGETLKSYANIADRLDRGLQLQMLQEWHALKEGDLEVGIKKLQSSVGASLEMIRRLKNPDDIYRDEPEETQKKLEEIALTGVRDSLRDLEILRSQKG